MTFLDLKNTVRAQVWPSGEARSRRLAHDKYFVDALIEIQTYVECLQQNNTDIIPQCATNYNCGLTSFDFSRAMIKELSVIDRIDSVTRLESATGVDDYCSAIPYLQVEACHMHRYLAQSAKRGCCMNLHLFFAIPQACVGGKGVVPVPTDEGLPEGLPTLPLGYKYPQTSTDYTRRAMSGVWAIERGRVMVAPWIQSTESILVKWDGIKRGEWNPTTNNLGYSDGDLIEPDPELIRAVKLYVQKEYERDENRDIGIAADYEQQFNRALQGLWYACRQETMVRSCETSKARGASAIITLYYNDARSFTASCAPNQTGTPKSVTIPADAVSSIISKQDANNKAYQQAQTQAQAQLVCTDIPVTYHNRQVIGTASCEQEEGAPVPDGSASSVTILANQSQYDSLVSEDAATALAQAAADAQAAAQSTCTFWNREARFTAECLGAVEAVIPAHTYSSTTSQAAADELAQNAAKLQSEADCPDVFLNTLQSFSQNGLCTTGPHAGCAFQMSVVVQAGQYSSVISQIDANNQAHNAGVSKAVQMGAVRCAQAGWTCQSFSVTIP